MSTTFLCGCSRVDVRRVHSGRTTTPRSTRAAHVSIARVRERTVVACGSIRNLGVLNWPHNASSPPPSLFGYRKVAAVDSLSAALRDVTARGASQDEVETDDAWPSRWPA
eukprot:9477883-Pyramimonas_sp.AAC.2